MVELHPATAGIDLSAVTCLINLLLTSPCAVFHQRGQNVPPSPAADLGLR